MCAVNKCCTLNKFPRARLGSQACGRREYCRIGHIFLSFHFPPPVSPSLSLTDMHVCSRVCKQPHMHRHPDVYFHIPALLVFKATPFKMFKHCLVHSRAHTSTPNAPPVLQSGDPSAASLLVDTDWPARADLTPVACQNKGSC